MSPKTCSFRTTKITITSVKMVIETSFKNYVLEFWPLHRNPSFKKVGKILKNGLNTLVSPQNGGAYNLTSVRTSVRPWTAISQKCMGQLV